MSVYTPLPSEHPSPILSYYHRLSTCTSPSAEPISPVDPAPPRKRQTQGTEFFSAVYLDSPSERGDLVGHTRPLRVRKRNVSGRVVGVAGRRRRRSTLSLPHSPRSPRTLSFPTSLHRPTRQNTTSSTSSHAHNTISRIFLASTPTAMSPPPLPTKHQARPISHPRVRCNRARATSDLHLGLGGAGYDESARPGPSPPISPAPSPTNRAFVTSLQPKSDGVRGNGQSILAPSSPLTPSRAPRKAAALLGMGYTAQQSRSATKQSRAPHFRPLPSQTLGDIEKFFGEIPRNSKPSRTPLKTRSDPNTSAQPRVEERRVGEGRTVRHRGEDGSMWLDVEEEQEFAWLMSEIFTLLPTPLPPVPGDTKYFDMSYNTNDAEDQWGMEAFVSVLSLPKVKKGKKAKVAKVHERRQNESFIDFDDSPSFPSSTRFDEADIAPWQGSEGDSRLLVPPPRSSPRGRSTPSGSGSDSDLCTSVSGSGRTSPPRLKNRPPPLTLRGGVPNNRLPTISTTPDPSKAPSAPSYLALHPEGTASRAPAPTTPFVRPRRAPLPNTDTILPIPRLPPTLTLDTDVYVSEQEISFFDPVTPIEARSMRTHRRILSGRKGGNVGIVSTVNEVAEKFGGVKSWGKGLKRVVKGGVRI